MSLRDMLTLARQAVARELELAANRVDAWVDTWAPSPVPVVEAPAAPAPAPAPVVSRPVVVGETMACWDCSQPPTPDGVLCKYCHNAALARMGQMHKNAPRKACAKRRPS